MNLLPYLNSIQELLKLLIKFYLYSAQHMYKPKGLVRLSL